MVWRGLAFVAEAMMYFGDGRRTLAWNSTCMSRACCRWLMLADVLVKRDVEAVGLSRGYEDWPRRGDSLYAVRLFVSGVVSGRW